MSCTFFGHRDAPYEIESDLKNAIIELIEKRGVKRFYVGNNGRFDFLAQKALKEIITQYTDVTFYIILSALSERAICGDQDNTLFPEGLENVPPRFAIFKRNDWLIKHASFVIAYAKYSASNTYQWIAKAKRKGLNVINIGK